MLRVGGGKNGEGVAGRFHARLSPGTLTFAIIHGVGNYRPVQLTTVRNRYERTQAYILYPFTCTFEEQA